MASFVGFFSNTLPRAFRRRNLSGSNLEGPSATDASPIHDLNKLHRPKSERALIDALTKGHLSMYINDVDRAYGGAPIHSIVRRSRNHQYTADLLTALLTYSRADVNLPDSDGKCPLHIAVEGDNIECTKVLIAFDADIDATDRDGQTPLDLALSAKKPIYLKSIKKQESWTFVVSPDDTDGQPHSLKDDGVVYSEIGQLLLTVGASHGGSLPPPTRQVEEEEEEEVDLVLGEGEEEEEEEEGGGGEEGEEEEPRRKPLRLKSGIDLTAEERRDNYMFGAETRTLYREMEDNINQRTDSLMSLTSMDEMMSMQMQRKENARYRATGARILSLDGGGMKGLVEIDFLSQLEKETGKSVLEMFDWIFATSTGAILILGMLYAKKTLTELRQLYFRLKEDVFASPRFGLSYNTKALEDLIKEVLGTDMTLQHDKENMPKVVITAVSKANKNPEIHFFSNCFDDELSRTPIWKVARYTSAAPMFFREFENYVDGGVLANNPCQVALTRIENYHWQMGQKLPIALVVSVGSGIYPQEKLGSINAQEYLYFGAHWFRLKGSIHEFKNLVELLSNAIVESEMVANTTATHCRERGIPFYRISPNLDDIIAAGETDNHKLTQMIITARAQNRTIIPKLVEKLCPEIGSRGQPKQSHLY